MPVDFYFSFKIVCDFFAGRPSDYYFFAGARKFFFVGVFDEVVAFALKPVEEHLVGFVVIPVPDLGQFFGVYVCFLCHLFWGDGLRLYKDFLVGMVVNLGCLMQNRLVFYRRIFNIS